MNIISNSSSFSGVTRILSQEEHVLHVYEIRQKSQKFIHKCNKLENVKLGRMRKLLGARAPVLVLVTPVSFFVDYAATFT